MIPIPRCFVILAPIAHCLIKDYLVPERLARMRLNVKNSPYGVRRRGPDHPSPGVDVCRREAAAVSYSLHSSEAEMTSFPDGKRQFRGRRAEDAHGAERKFLSNMTDGELDEFFFEDSIPLDGRRCFFVKLDPFAGLFLNSPELQAFFFSRSRRTPY